MKVAASLILLASATALIWTSTGPQTETQLTVVQESPKQVTTQPEVENLPATTPTPAAVQEKYPAPGKGGVTAPVLPERSATPPEIRLTQISRPVTALVELREPSLMHRSETSSAQNGIVLIYSAKEVNEKYLDKKALAQATSDNGKPSTLQKLLSKAYELKTTSSPMADLRQMKDEIFALNFRGEKQRTQNK